MPLHVESEKLLGVLLGNEWSRPGAVSIAEGRVLAARQVAEFAGAPTMMAAVSEQVIPGPGGDLTIRVYRPTDARSPGIFVWVHGGGFTGGSIDQSDVLIRALAAAADCTVVAVDYRLAPEHPFPAGLEDCYATVEWAAAYRAELGAPEAPIAVGGESAGACLAAGVTLLTRERSGPRIEFQTLVYPVIGWGRPTAPSWWDAEVPYYPSLDSIARMEKLYLDGHDPDDPLAAPLTADSLAGLPPAFVLTAEFDVLRADAERYAARLSEAGVVVETAHYDGMLHGFLDFTGVPGLAEIASEGLEQVGGVVRNAFGAKRAVSSSGACMTEAATRPTAG
jgi:acetyl esterase